MDDGENPWVKDPENPHSFAARICEFCLLRSGACSAGDAPLVLGLSGFLQQLRKIPTFLAMARGIHASLIFLAHFSLSPFARNIGYPGNPQRPLRWLASRAPGHTEIVLAPKSCVGKGQAGAPLPVACDMPSVGAGPGVEADPSSPSSVGRPSSTF